MSATQVAENAAKVGELIAEIAATSNEQSQGIGQVNTAVVEMAILAECPFYHRKQGVKNKFCSCGSDLDKAKDAKKVKYWISYRGRWFGLLFSGHV